MLDVFTWPVGRAAGTESLPDYPGSRPPVAPVLSYLLAATVAGALTGVVIAIVGAGIRASSITIDIGVILALGLGSFTTLIQLVGESSFLPQRRKQVPRQWLLWRSRSLTALGFGLIIGAGFLTPLRYAAAYTLLLIALLAPGFYAPIIVGLIYGGTRGMSLVLTWVADRRGRQRWNWSSWFESRPINWLLATLGAAGLIVAAIS